MTEQTHTDHETRRQIEPGDCRPVEPGPSRRALLAGVGAAIVAAAGGASLPAFGAVLTAPSQSTPVARAPMNAHHRLELAAMEFKAAYEAVHADVYGWHVVRDDQGYIRFLAPLIGVQPVKWSGDGRYEVEEGNARPVYWITREPRYDDGPERWFRVSTGFKGPLERPDFCCPEHHMPKLVRKLGSGEAA